MWHRFLDRLFDLGVMGFALATVYTAFLSAAGGWAGCAGAMATIAMIGWGKWSSDRSEDSRARTEAAAYRGVSLAAIESLRNAPDPTTRAAGKNLWLDYGLQDWDSRFD
jgi:hypothetical protein